MIWAVWLSFWGDLNTPSSFPDDPEGGMKNQASHVLIGLILSAWVCVGWALVAGEMPYRLGVWCAVVSTYFWFEMKRQEWQGADTLIDTGFVGLGAAVPLVSLKEVAFQPEIDLRLQLAGAILILIAIPVAVLAYGAPRMVRKYRATTR